MERCREGHWVPSDAPEQLCPECLLSLAEPEPEPELRQVGPFQLLGVLGQGGFGLVYRARREGSQEWVALKVLRNLEFADARGIAKFRREPLLSAKLDPRYVVQVLEVGEHLGVPYFTMEYMAGGTLRARLSDYRDAPQRAAQLMIEIATAVHYLHRDSVRPEREPILHRDLKPENILFGAHGPPRISDFGIAKLATGNIWKHDTHPVGCACYVAPEQVFPTRERELTAAADVYALGAILYELFTGRPPFDGTDAEILYQLKRDEPVPPSRLTPGLDRFLETVVLNALEKDPTRRYRSAAAFAQDLERALQQRPPEEIPVVAPTARIRTWLRKHPLTVGAGVWLASLLVVIALSARSELDARTSGLDREQQINASVAGMQAVAVNLQLQAYRHRHRRARPRSRGDCIARSGVGLHAVGSPDHAPSALRYHVRDVAERRATRSHVRQICRVSTTQLRLSRLLRWRTPARARSLRELALGRSAAQGSHRACLHFGE